MRWCRYGMYDFEKLIRKLTRKLIRKRKTFSVQYLKEIPYPDCCNICTALLAHKVCVECCPNKFTEKEKSLQKRLGDIVNNILNND